MHATWVHMISTMEGHLDGRQIQVKSFSNYAEAEAYVRTSSIPLSAYLAYQLVVCDHPRQHLR
ncbi:hypothetical protein C7I87_33220 [Mesorhizobium sp. SARCC-RB16n]|nr:hypothetical protein C7I87_33220 [Mesorhizobium sp. SARCC-RB16n]